MHVENFDNTLSTEINDENNSSVDLNKYNIHEVNYNAYLYTYICKIMS